MNSYKDELKIKSIAQNTWMITDFFNDHMYLLEGTKEALLIDTGIGSLTLSNRIREITDKPLRVALSHGHVDHIGATAICGSCREQTVYLSQEDFSLYKEHSNPEYKRAFLEEKSKRYGTMLTEHEKAEYLAGLISLKPCEHLRPLPDRFELGDRTVRILSTPGHTMGSVCFWDEKTHILFSGDTVCNLCVLLTFKDSAPLEVFLSSLKKLSSYPVDRVYCGHHCGQVSADSINRYISLCRHVLSIPKQERRGQYCYGDIFSDPATDCDSFSICI